MICSITRASKWSSSLSTSYLLALLCWRTTFGVKLSWSHTSPPWWSVVSPTRSSSLPSPLTHGSLQPRTRFGVHLLSIWCYACAIFNELLLTLSSPINSSSPLVEIINTCSFHLDHHGENVLLTLFVGLSSCSSYVKPSVHLSCHSIITTKLTTHTARGSSHSPWRLCMVS